MYLGDGVPKVAARLFTCRELLRAAHQNKRLAEHISGPPVALCGRRTRAPLAGVALVPEVDRQVRRRWPSMATEPPCPSVAVGQLSIVWRDVAPGNLRGTSP